MLSICPKCKKEKEVEFDLIANGICLCDNCVEFHIPLDIISSFLKKGFVTFLYCEEKHYPYFIGILKSVGVTMWSGEKEFIIGEGGFNQDRAVFGCKNNKLFYNNMCDVNSWYDDKEIYDIANNRYLKRVGEPYVYQYRKRLIIFEFMKDIKLYSINLLKILKE